MVFVMNAKEFMLLNIKEFSKQGNDFMFLLFADPPRLLSSAYQTLSPWR
jgi:hypothetical protein